MTTKIASFCPAEIEPIPITGPEHPGTLLDALSSVMKDSVRMKPTYSDTWILQSDPNSEQKLGYLTDFSAVSILEL